MYWQSIAAVVIISSGVDCMFSHVVCYDVAWVSVACSGVDCSEVCGGVEQSGAERAEAKGSEQLKC